MLKTALKCRTLKLTSSQSLRFKASAAAQRVTIKEDKINELENAISIDFSDYTYDLPAIKSYEERVRQDKSITRKPSAEMCETLFYYYASQHDNNRMMVTYLDHRQVSVPSLRMCQYMMMSAGESNNATIAKTVVDDLFSIRHSKWNQETVLICLKTLSLFGSMSQLIRVYERMFLDGNLPDLRHWSFMLRGAARAGCPKYFVRWHQRIIKKGYRLSPYFIRTLLDQWGSHDDWNWKLSKEACMSTLDFCVMISLAQRYRNYKLACQFIHDIYRLDTQPTLQVYEVFTRGVSRDLPAFRLDAREWRLKWTGITGILDKQTRTDFESWVEDIKHFIGAENLSYLPLQPIVRRPTKRQTVKERKAEKGLLRKRVRYVSQFTDDENLFEMVPAYLRRIKYEEEKKNKEALARQQEQAVEQVIEEAKEARKKWELFGFKMNYAVDDSISSGSLPPETEVLPRPDNENEPLAQRDWSVYPHLENILPEKGKIKKPSKKRPHKGKGRYSDH